MKDSNKEQKRGGKNDKGQEEWRMKDRRTGQRRRQGINNKGVKITKRRCSAKAKTQGEENRGAKNKEEDEQTLVLQVASLFSLLICFPLALRGSVLQHQLVLLQQGRTGLGIFPCIRLRRDGTEKKKIITNLKREA